MAAAGGGAMAASTSSDLWGGSLHELLATVVWLVNSGDPSLDRYGGHLQQVLSCLNLLAVFTKAMMSMIRMILQSVLCSSCCELSTVWF